MKPTTVLALIFASVAILLAAYYYFYAEKQRLVNECISLCISAKQSKELSNGPCLAEHMSNPDWVCDVAHWPREAVDNLAENQCSSYGKTAKHFIEVTPDCKFIRAV